MSDNKAPDNNQPPGFALGKGMLTVTWIGILVGLTFVFGVWEDKQYNPNRQVDALNLNDEGIKEIVLKRNRFHHYVATGKINGRKVTFMLDTGATDVAVPKRIAEKLGLRPMGVSRAITANGTVDVETTKIDTLALGNIQLYDVRASINPGMVGTEILLGMSALKQVEFTQSGDTLTIRQYP